MQDKKFSLQNLVLIAGFTLFIGTVGGSFLATSFPGWASQIGLKIPFNQVTKPSDMSDNAKIVVVDEENSVTKVVEDVSPAVVSVVTKEVGFDPETGIVEEDQGIGTGFIIDKNGVVMTNAHVVSNESTEYTVVTRDKKSYPVTRVDRDPVNDVAILRIDATDLPVAKLGDSTKLKVGQTVIAIGNALGKFDNSVTKGVISQIGRTVTAGNGLFGQSETLEDVIQTDAALNPGNSGGPLLNIEGEVIGINVATTVGAQNIGFAIPINTAKTIYQGYQEYGRILRPYLGVSHQLIQGNTKIPSGALIRAVVPGSPAEKSGIRVRDIITKVDGKTISLDSPLSSAIAKKKIGDTIDIEIWRDTESIKVKATLEQTPEENK